MKQNYEPKHLTKQQRHMKKWIPEGVYCEGSGEGSHKKPCPFHHILDYGNPSMDDEEYLEAYEHPYIQNREHRYYECNHKKVCEFDKDVSKCTMPISYCAFLKYVEYGQYPLGDMGKVCGIRDYW